MGEFYTRWPLRLYSHNPLAVTCSEILLEWDCYKNICQIVHKMSISFLIRTVHEHYFLVWEFLKKEISWKIIITDTEWDFLLNLQQYLLMDEENRVKGFIFILMAFFTRKRKITLNLITQHYFYRPGLWKKVNYGCRNRYDSGLNPYPL